MSDPKAESDSKMASTKPASDPKGVLAIQSTASLVSLSIYAGIMILHAMAVRSGLAYAGLVLPHHVIWLMLRFTQFLSPENVVV